MAFVAKTVNPSQKHKNLQGGVPCNSGVSRNCSELCPGRAATVNGPEGSPARPFPKAATLTFMPQSTLLEKFGSALDGIESLKFISDSEKEAIIGRIRSAEFIDITLDYGIRYVFGNHPELLKMLLEDILQLEIQELDRLPEEVVGTYVQDKYIVMDIGVVLKNGQRIIVEMQSTKKDDLRSRLVYYGSALIYNQLKRGADVYKYGDVHVLMLLNENLDHEDPDDCRLVYLPNLVKGSKEPMNVIEQWFYYFRNMKKFSTLAGGPKILDERYRPLIEASKTRRFTDQEWKEYIKAMYTEKELENITKPYFEDGLRKGIEQGIAQGVAQGVAQSKAEIAKTMLAKGYDPATVQELTGLTVERGCEGLELSKRANTEPSSSRTPPGDQLTAFKESVFCKISHLRNCFPAKYRIL